MKVCSKCKLEQVLEEFSPSCSSCKECNRKKTRIWREKNKNKLPAFHKKWREDNLEAAIESGKRWRKKNPEKLLAAGRKWRKNNRVRHRELAKRWRDKNPEKCRQIKNNWRKKSGPAQLAAKLSNYYRVRVRQALHGLSKAAPTLEMLGCTIPEFRQHIESQFRPGMTWENYGPVWHIDHIKACSKFNLSDPEQQKACFSLV